MSLIGFGQPSATATISGTGASFDTSTDQLFDSQPGSVTRCTAVSGAQTTASVTKIQLTFTSATAIRILTMLGVTLPTGLKVTVAGKRTGDSGYPYALSGNALTQRLVTFADGSVGAWWVFPAANTALVGLEISLFNDVGGSSPLSASYEFDIGEIGAFQGLDVRVKRTLKDSLEDPSRLRRSPANQPNKFFRRPYRVLAADITPVASITALRSLRYTLATTTTCAFIPQFVTPGTTTLDPDLLHETAMFGTMTAPLNFDTIADGLYWQGSMQFQEYPPA